MRIPVVKLLTMITFLLIPSAVFAQNCKNHASNSLFVNGISDMKLALDEHDYDKVLEAGRDIYGICPDSPTYLFYLACAFEGKGDLAKAREYIYKASDNTSVYETQKHMIQQIWYKRYELDNPDRTKPAIDELHKQIDSLKTRVDELKQDSDQLEKTSTKTEMMSLKLSENTAVHQDDLMMGVWIGTGIGGTGLAVLAAGIGLLATEIKNPITSTQELPKRKVQIHNEYLAGWTLLGIGSAFTVAGAIIAGIYGYQFTHQNDDTSVAFQISPTSASLRLAF